MVANRRLAAIVSLVLLISTPALAQDEDPSPAADAEVTVVAPTVDAVAIEPGMTQDYTFEINVTCPAQSLHTQPVQVTVNATLDAGAAEGVSASVEPGTLEFTFDPGACAVEAASQNETVTLSVQVPEDAAGNVPVTAGVEASAGDSSDSATIDATTGVTGTAAVETEDEAPSGTAGETYNVTLTLTNDANVDVTFSFAISNESGEVRQSYTVPGDVQVTRGSTATAEVLVAVPGDVSSRFDETFMLDWTAAVDGASDVTVDQGTTSFTASAAPDPATEDSPAAGVLPLVLVATLLVGLLRRRVHQPL